MEGCALKKPEPLKNLLYWAANFLTATSSMGSNLISGNGSHIRRIILETNDRKLLMVDMGAAWGGQEIYSRCLSTNLESLGWEITNVSSHSRHGVPGRNFAHCDVSYLSFAKTRQLVTSLAKTVDIVHFNGLRAIYLSRFIEANVPFVATKHSPHGFWRRSGLREKFVRRAMSVAYDKLDTLICVSAAVKEELPIQVQKRSRIIVNGVSDMAGKPSIIDNKSHITICYVGRLVPEKNVLRLIEVATLTKKIGLPVKFLVAGSGPLMTEMQHSISKSGLSGSVTMIGHVERPEFVYRESDICLLPSEHEGMPLSLIEAASAGCVLLGHDVPGVRDIIQHNMNGILTGSTAGELFEAIKKLVENPSFRKKLSERARSDYLSKWTLGRMASETHQVYIDLLSGIEEC